MTRQSEVNAWTWEHGLQKGSRVLQKAQKDNQENERTANPENSKDRHYGAIHHRITGVSEGNRNSTKTGFHSHPGILGTPFLLTTMEHTGQLGLNLATTTYHCDPQLVRSPMLPTLHQKTTGSLLWSRFFIGCQSGKYTHALLPKPPQTQSLVSWESNANGSARKFHPDQPVQPRQARLPVGSISRLDYTGSGLFVPAESPDSLCHFSDSFLVIRG
ncbi:hypothetical protein CRG98_042107 [Punica granatum]|uniref:Uncharacterized protein n=1 Tax=Punica granatum TaxID=22663 RepID=A0A2I0I0K6_PUNGR|nr:hypothetical protein CRG98_042107 [Punica granatum]